MQITPQQLLLILPGARNAPAGIFDALNQSMTRYRIDSAPRIAAFLAQVGHESGQLTRSVENLNYSAERLAAIWPNRFAAGGRPNARAIQLARQPEAIANAVYGGRLGNGPEQSGDGWRFRGRGLIQTTGRANYRATGQGIGADLEHAPELLEQPRYAALSAAWFWQEHGLNELADAGQFEAITKRINGGLHGLAERVALWETAKRVLA